MDINKGGHNSSKMRENEPITITKLTEYLVDRYDLSTAGRSCLDYSRSDGLGGYRKKIERILKNTKHGNMRLYDWCSRGGVREISINMFIKYCFPEWKSYLEGMKENFSKDKMEIDCKKYEELNEPELTDEEKYYEEMDISEERWYEYSEKVLHEYGTRLMIEGIFKALYGEFDWEKLEFDLERREEYYDPNNWYKFNDYVEEDYVNDYGEIVSYTSDQIEKIRMQTEMLCKEYENSIGNLSSFENYIKKKNIKSSLNDIIEKENNNEEQLKKVARMIKGLK